MITISSPTTTPASGFGVSAVWPTLSDLERNGELRALGEGEAKPELEEEPWWRQACRHSLLTSQEELLLAHRIRAGDQAALHRLMEHNFRLVVRIAMRYQKTPMRCVSFDDLFQEGCLGLMTAARRFDPARQLRFSTYAVPWVQQAMARYLVRHDAMLRAPESALRERDAQDRIIAELAQNLGRKPTPSEIEGALRGAGQITARPVYDVLSFDAPLEGAEVGEGWSEQLREDNEKNDPVVELANRATREMMRATLDAALQSLTLLQAKVIRMRYGLDGEGGQTLVEIGKTLGITSERARQLERTGLKNLRRVLRERDFLDADFPENEGEESASGRSFAKAEL